MIEGIVHDQANKFLSGINILHDFQSGFRPNHSRNQCLAHLIDKIFKRFVESVLDKSMFGEPLFSIKDYK